MSLQIFLEPYWRTESHRNKSKDECMEMKLNKQCHWQMVVVTYFACTKACKIEWDKIFQHSLLFLPASFKENLQIFSVFFDCLNILFRLNRFLPNIRLKPSNVILTSILETPKQVCILPCVKTVYFYLLLAWPRY